jgi:hypothetical protein
MEAYTLISGSSGNCIYVKNGKDEILNTIPDTKKWIHFDEGMLYLDTLKSDIITQEKISTVSSGDNSYALCRQN